LLQLVRDTGGDNHQKCLKNKKYFYSKNNTNLCQNFTFLNASIFFGADFDFVKSNNVNRYVVLATIFPRGKIEILVKNLNTAIIPPDDFLSTFRKQNVTIKGKLLYWSEMIILVRNQNCDQKSKFGSTIGISIKNFFIIQNLKTTKKRLTTKKYFYFNSKNNNTILWQISFCERFFPLDFFFQISGDTVSLIPNHHHWHM